MEQARQGFRGRRAVRAAEAPSDRAALVRSSEGLDHAGRLSSRRAQHRQTALPQYPKVTLFVLVARS